MAESLIGKQYRPDITGYELNLTRRSIIIASNLLSRVFTILTDPFMIVESLHGVDRSVMKVIVNDSKGDNYLFNFDRKFIIAELNVHTSSTTQLPKKELIRKKSNKSIDEKELEYSTPAFDKIEYDDEIIEDDGVVEDDEDDRYFDDEEDDDLPF